LTVIAWFRPEARRHQHLCKARGTPKGKVKSSTKAPTTSKASLKGEKKETGQVGATEEIRTDTIDGEVTLSITYPKYALSRMVVLIQRDEPRKVKVVGALRKQWDIV